jgi:hypothetical protein
VLANRAVKAVSAYLSPTESLTQSDLTEFLSGTLPVLVAGDINAKYAD